MKLVSLGTVEPRKNYQAAVAVLDSIRARLDAAAELHIIGRAGWGDAGAAIASHPGVVVHGYLPADGVKRVLEAADVYLCTSHDEGLGLPLLEAQFAGLPIVAPDKPVFREVLAGSGTFIESRSRRRHCKCNQRSDRAAKLARPAGDCRNEQRSALERRCRA